MNRIISVVLAVAVLSIGLPGDVVASPTGQGGLELGQSTSEELTRAIEEFRTINRAVWHLADIGPGFSRIEPEKAQILKFGEDAIEPLMALLAESLKRYDESRDEASWLNRTFPLGGPSFTLIRDCCELLGKLRASAAVPLIIVALERDEAFAAVLPYVDAEAEALVRIGRPGAPFLVTEIKNIYGKVFQESGSPENERGRDMVERQTRDNQLRLAGVLERIGNEDTIKALEDLLNSGDYMGASARSVIISTIGGIRERTAFSPFHQLNSRSRPR